MTKTSTKKAKRKSSPYQKLARKISAHFKGFNELRPAEQMEVYCRVGRELDEVGFSLHFLGRAAVAELMTLLPQVSCPMHLVVMRHLATASEEDREFYLSQAAVPLSNGQPLDLDHWVWVICNGPQESNGRRKRQERELAWLRREALSGAVIAHIKEVLSGEHDREMEDFRKQVREKLGELELLACW